MVSQFVIPPSRSIAIAESYKAALADFIYSQDQTRISSNPPSVITTQELFVDEYARNDRSGFEKWYIPVYQGDRFNQATTERYPNWSEGRMISISGMASLGSFSQSRLYIQETVERFILYLTSIEGMVRIQDEIGGRLAPSDGLRIRPPHDLKADFFFAQVGEVWMYQTRASFRVGFERVRRQVL